MSKEYQEYVKRCNELGVKPKPEFAPIQVNWDCVKWVLIVTAIMANIVASAMAALMKTKR